MILIIKIIVLSPQRIDKELSMAEILSNYKSDINKKKPEIITSYYSRSLDINNKPKNNNYNNISLFSLGTLSTNENITINNL